MEKLVKTLESVGFTKKQALVYVALLQTGEATVAEVARAAGIKRPTTYLVLEELEIMELVFSKSDKKRVYYTAKDPKEVQRLMFSREKLVERIMPDLSAIYKQEMFFNVYNCEQAVDIFFDLFENSKEVLCFIEISDVHNLILNEIKKNEDKIKRMILIKNMTDEGISDFQWLVEKESMRFFEKKESDNFCSIIIFDEETIAVFPRGNKDSFVLVKERSFFETQKVFFDSIFEKSKNKNSLNFVQIPRET